jgi:hypothetical protein
MPNPTKGALGQSLRPENAKYRRATSRHQNRQGTCQRQHRFHSTYFRISLYGDLLEIIDE